jgi:hypothetical protein
MPAVFEASPPAASSAAALSSFMDSMVEQRVQLIATIVQYANNVWNTLGQEMVQEVASFRQQLDRILGISPNTQAQPSNTTATQPDGGTAKNYASGSGSGSGTTSTHENIPAQGRTEVQPLTSGSGSGSPAFGSASSIVYGYLWLDNNGDGSWDNNESGYSGDTVALWINQGSGWVSGPSTTSNSSGYYSIQTKVPVSGNPQFGIPLNLEATIPGGTSKIINAQGFTAAFLLPPGGIVQKTGGLARANASQFLRIGVTVHSQKLGAAVAATFS